MFWPDRGSGVPVEPARRPVASAVRQYFTEGGAGQAPTVPGGDWFNQITNEVLNVLSAAGIEPSKADDDQLLLAIKIISKMPGLVTRGLDKFSILQGRSGEHREDTLTRGIAVELNEPISGSGFSGGSNTYMFNRLLIADDSVDAQNDGTSGTKVDGLIVQHDFGGDGTRGGRHAAEFMLTQRAPTESDNTDRNYVGLVGYCATLSGDGGTDMTTGRRGAYFGGNFYTTIKNATYVNHANGCESNVLIDAASSVYYRSGYSAVSGGDLQATMYDAAYSVGALGASGAQWRDGILMGVQNGRNPISRSMIRGESLSISKILSFSGSIPSDIITSDADARFNFRVDRLEMFYTNASLKLGAKDSVNTPVIEAYTDATGNRAGRLIFTGTAATPDNGVCNVQFRQTVVRELAPGAANTYTCGTASLPWAGGFTQAAFTVTSDENAKTKPEAFPDAMLDAAAEVDWVLFQYLDRVEEKGPDKARWHFGAIAQRFVEAFQRRGLKPYDYAFICYDEWEDQYEQVVTNAGQKVTLSRKVQRPVFEMVTRKVQQPVILDDGTVTIIERTVESPLPKMKKTFLYETDDSPSIGPDGTHRYELVPVTEEVDEEYEEFAEPQYEDVLVLKAGSRHGIRYEQAIILKQRQIERDHLRRLKALEDRLSLLESR